MEKITVPFITGDGVGAEITPSMQAVVNTALKKLMETAGVSNGKKCWRVSGHLMKRVPGYQKKRWKHSELIRLVLKVR